MASVQHKWQIETVYAVYSIGNGQAVRITVGLSMIYFLKMNLLVINDQLHPNIHTFVLDRQPADIKHHTLESKAYSLGLVVPKDHV